jgi:single-stranded DNA-binding protein
MTEAAVSFAGNLTDQPELRHTEAGSARSAVEVVAEELGASLRWRRQPRPGRRGARTASAAPR